MPGERCSENKDNCINIVLFVAVSISVFVHNFHGKPLQLQNTVYMYI